MTTSVTARWNLMVLLAYRRVGEPRDVQRLGSVSSTQDVARTLPIGSVVVADHQTAGRGRLDRSWESRRGGALLASFVLPPNPLLSLAAGVAAAEACGGGVRLKWPNDLLLNGAKLGGILVEATPSKAICGIGICHACVVIWDRDDKTSEEVRSCITGMRLKCMKSCSGLSTAICVTS